jgi:signal transduction histidine kinase/CheY-like chemotaxis protein
VFPTTPQADPDKRHAQRHRHWLAASLGAFAVLAVSLFALVHWQDRRATLAHGWADADSAASLLASEADRLLRPAEMILLRLDGPRDAAGLGDLLADAPELAGLAKRDGAGSLLVGVPPGLHPAEPGPVPAGPRVMLARGGGPQARYLVLRRRLDDGHLAEALLAVASLSATVEPLLSAPDALFVLLGPDGVTELHRMGAPGALPDRPSRQAIETWPDGVARLTVTHVSPMLGVTAMVGLSEAAVLAPYRARLFRHGALFGLAVALAGSVGAAALAGQRRERRARAAAEQRGAALATLLAEREPLLASLRQGAARLRLAEEAGGIGLWEWDLTTGRLLLEGSVFLAWGFGTRRRLRAPLALRVILREDRPALAAALAAAQREGARLNHAVRLALPGQPRWVALRAELQRDAAGQPLRLLGVALDVSGQRRAAAALEEANALLERRVAERTGALAEANARLREGEARFRGIFDATFQLIGLLSPDGTVLEANAALRRQAAPATAQGSRLWDLAGWPADTLRAAVATAAEGRFVRREISLPDGDRPRAIDLSVTPLRDEDGIVSLLVLEGRDISDVKAAQALLLEAQKMDTLGQLTGGVAHDFNNLLMAVLGNLALARRRLGADLAPETARHLDAAVQGAERGALLTQRLLAFARRQDLRPAAVDLAALLAGIQELLARSAGPRVRVAVTAPPELPPALVDPHALELAVMNLVVNARDAMPAGGEVTITIGMATPPLPATLPAGRYLRITVADNGTGMDAATLARAVEPFFSTKPTGQGTGLGLSMVHGLAHQSGGALTITSQPGAGTQVSLFLQQTSAMPEIPAAPRPAPAPALTPAPSQGCVLVVDDEPLVLDSTAAMLEVLGHTPLPAPSAEAALALLDGAQGLVAVVTDHAMPGMSGAALAAEIGRRRPGLPVIIATGHAGAAEGHGAALLLAKPYGLPQLADALAQVGQRPAAA